MAPQSICCRPHLAKIKRHFLHSKINIKRCNLLSKDQQMLDKEQVAINSILELNEGNVKMKITLTVEGLVFQYSGGSIKRETFFQQNKKSF